MSGQLTKLSSSQNLDLQKKKKKRSPQKNKTLTNQHLVKINDLLALIGNKEAVLGVQNRTTFYDHILHE